MPAKGKAAAIARDGGTAVRGAFFQQNLVCVVQNSDFDAALFCDMAEFRYIKSHPDPRPKTWMVYDHAKELSGYNKQ